MPTLIVSVALAMIGALAIGPSSAQASWGPVPRCSYGVGHHCYSLTELHPGAGEHIAGAVATIDTGYGSVPGWAEGDFVTNEMWVGFGGSGEDWLETGQIDGPYGTLVPFLESWTNDTRYVEYIPAEELAAGQRYYYWIVDPNDNGSWSVYWFQTTLAQAYSEHPVFAENRPWDYSSEVEVGEEAAANTEPAVDGESIVAANNKPPPSNPWSPWQHAEEFVTGGMCGEPDYYWTHGYPGSWLFGAGSGVCGSKEREDAVNGEAALPSEAANPVFHASTGEELLPEDVRAVAMHESELAGEPAPEEITAAKSSVGVASDVMAPGQELKVNKTDEGWLGSDAYVVVLRGKRFSAFRSLPRGDKQAPSGAVMTLLVDAHTGEVEGMSISQGNEVPAIGQLGAMNLTSVQDAQAATASVPHATITTSVYAIDGKPQRTPHPSPGKIGIAWVQVRRGGSVKEHHGFRYTFAVSPGHYTVTASTRPPEAIPGKICQSKPVTVHRGEHLNLKLYCGP